jgi:phage shock protein PspC (stress-responsive transcriptional regulator)
MPPIARWRADDGAILGGVARDFGVRTGVDPLWFRIAFVVLTVFSGLGLLLYIGSWLILRGRRRSPFGPLVIAGVAVIVVSCVGLLGASGTRYIDSPWTIVFVLAGVAVALWQPRSAAQSAVVVPGSSTRSSAPTEAAEGAWEKQPPSTLGRWALAAALVVGAAGAVGYQLADDGLHPERWLGAAAAVCGLGIVVGAWRGRALWLTAPGLLFAASGFVAGHAARAGIDELELGNRDFYVDSIGGSELPGREDLIAGEIEVAVHSAPPEVSRSDLRIGLGVIDIVVDDDVTVEVRAHVRSGDIVVDGDERPHDGDVQVIRVGPEANPDVVIQATVSVGRLEIDQRQLPQRARIDDRLFQED